LAAIFNFMKFRLCV